MNKLIPLKSSSSAIIHYFVNCKNFSEGLYYFVLVMPTSLGVWRFRILLPVRCTWGCQHYDTGMQAAVSRRRIKRSVHMTRVCCDSYSHHSSSPMESTVHRTLQASHNSSIHPTRHGERTMMHLPLTNTLTHTHTCLYLPKKIIRRKLLQTEKVNFDSNNNNMNGPLKSMILDTIRAHIKDTSVFLQIL